MFNLDREVMFVADFGLVPFADFADVVNSCDITRIHYIRKDRKWHNSDYQRKVILI